MYFLGIFLVSFVFCVNASFKPIDHDFINTFDTIDEKLSVFADSVNYRLPNNTKPISYVVELVTNVHEGDFNFTGTVTISFKVLESNSTTITLHAGQLTIISVELQSSAGMHISSKYTQSDKTTEFLTITSEDTLVQNSNYRVQIKYSGELRDDNKGFYKASYVNANREQKQVLLT